VGIRKFTELTKTCFWRVTHSNFQHLKANDTEREALAQHGVLDPLAQDYAVWRRALLFLGSISMALWALVNLLTATSMQDRIRRGIQKGPALRPDEIADQRIAMLGSKNLAILDDLDLIVTISVIVGAVLILLGSRTWADIRRSRRWTRGAFYVVFITPFVMAAIPFSAFMDFGHLDSNQSRGVTIILGTTVGMKIFLLLAPRALTIFPASIRASMTLKTLIPESPLPGWVTAFFAPTYPVFLIVMVALVNQIHGDFLLLVGMIFLVIAPLVYLRHGRHILRPNEPEEVDTFVVGARHRALVFNVVGGALIAIYVLRLDFFSIGDSIRFVVAFTSNFLLVTVFTSDFMLAFMYVSHKQANMYEQTNLARSAGEKFAGLSDVGLTDLRAARPKKPKV
jgi:hypothetical protein